MVAVSSAKPVQFQLYSSAKPVQFQLLRDATAEVCPVHCWVASLVSMDSMTLAMVFMMIPFPWRRRAPDEAGPRCRVGVPKQLHGDTADTLLGKSRPASGIHTTDVVKRAWKLRPAASI